MNFKGTNRTSCILVLFLCKQRSFCSESVCHILSAVTHAECCTILHTDPKSSEIWVWCRLNMSQGDRICSRRTGQLSCWVYPYYWTSGLGCCFEKLNWGYSFVVCSSTRESGFWIYIYVRKIINKLHEFAMEIADYAGCCFLLLFAVQLLLYCKDPRCTSLPDKSIL